METPYNQFKEIRNEKKFVANKLGGLAFESVLEVGSQWGEVLVVIKERFPEVKVVGIDIDKDVTNNARNITNLDLRVGDVLSNNFHNKEFDVVVADALFCMMRPEDVEQAFKEMVRIARKYIVLVELENNATGFVKGGRTGANWIDLFIKHGMICTSKEKITTDMWDATPWSECGHIYLASFNGAMPEVKNNEVTAWCDSCDSKGVRHKKVCPKNTR